MSSRATQQIVRDALSEATKGAEPGSTAANVLQQFVEASATSPLLCAEPFFKSIDGLPAYSSVNWQPQAVTALSYAMVFEYAFQDLVTAAVQLLQMFLPRYKKNQLQQSRRAMLVLVRSMRYCLTSEGEQAVVTAVISLLTLNVFVDGSSAFQALTKMALFGLEKKHDSPASKLATWGVIHLAQRNAMHCQIIDQTGAQDVLVQGVALDPVAALAALAGMAEQNSTAVWESLVKLSGLDTLVKQAQSFELQSQREVEVLAQIIGELQKLLQHPHQQEVVLQQLKSSNALELLFVCAKANVAPVSQAAIDCLVLIWQWYLRKSPSASFSDSQLSCFLGADLSDAAAAHSKESSDTDGFPATNLPFRGQQQQQQQQQKAHGLNAVNGIRRASPHDSMASVIQFQPHKQQAQHQQPRQSAMLQTGASQLWSVTPVVDFAGGAKDAADSNAVGAGANPPVGPLGRQPSMQGTSSPGAAGQEQHHTSPEAQLQQHPPAPDVDHWINHSSRRSSSFLRRSFDAWNGIFGSSHRSSTSAMVSPYKASQPSNAQTQRRSFASFRRPPKSSKSPTASMSQHQADAYNRATGGTQKSYRLRSSLPVMHENSAHSLIPSCLQTPVKESQASYQHPQGLQQGVASAQHAQSQPPAVAPHSRAPATAVVPRPQVQAPAVVSNTPEAAVNGNVEHNGSASPLTVKRGQPNVLQYIQTWLDANPEGHWHPTGDQQGPLANKSLPEKGPLVQPSTPCALTGQQAQVLQGPKRQALLAPMNLSSSAQHKSSKSLVSAEAVIPPAAQPETQTSTSTTQQTGAILGHPTPELRRSAQRELNFSPLSVTPSGAHTHVGTGGRLQTHKQASPIGPSTPTKEASDAVWPQALDSTQDLSKASSSRAESVWESPAVTWSASGSSLLTVPKLNSTATGVSSYNESGPMTADNVSKVSFDTKPISVVTSSKEGQATGHSSQQGVLGSSIMDSAGKSPKSKNRGWKKIAAWFAE